VTTPAAPVNDLPASVATCVEPLSDSAAQCAVSSRPVSLVAVAVAVQEHPSADADDGAGGQVVGDVTDRVGQRAPAAWPIGGIPAWKTTNTNRQVSW
jgi:hypothetical protein